MFKTNKKKQYIAVSINNILLYISFNYEKKNNNKIKKQTKSTTTNEKTKQEMSIVTNIIHFIFLKVLDYSICGTCNVIF